jgi:glycosyltransferase involved in cell wall biosynthesis
VTLRVLAVSHSAAVETNQEPFRALARAGADVLVVAPRSVRTDVRGRIDFTPLPGFEANVVPVPVAIGGYRKLSGGQRGIHLIVYRGLRRIVASFAPDVLFAEEEPYSLAALQCARAAHAAGAPFVFHANQNVVKSLPPPFPGIRKAVFGHAFGATVRNSAAADVLRSQGFRGRVEPFPHAVDLERYARAAPAFEIGAEPPVIGFVGRLVPEKGCRLLVDAVARLRDRTGKGSVLVVGDGPERAALEAHAHASGVPARFLGAVVHERVPELYSAMDVVAIPSLTTPGWKEQFGRIVIEANAAGVPVIASASGELPDTVEATGGGIVVAENDVSALAGALVALCEDDVRRRGLGEAGRAGVAARFTPEAVAVRLLAFLSSVAEAGRVKR